MHNSFQIYMLKVHTERGNSPSNEQLHVMTQCFSCAARVRNDDHCIMKYIKFVDGGGKEFRITLKVC